MRSLLRVAAFLLALGVNDISARERAWIAPRLFDGTVNLQGVWAHTNLTPFERPSDLETLIISVEAAAQIKHKIDTKNDDLSKPGEPSFYFDDRSVEPIRGELRSSIVIDPVDGRIPGNEVYKEKLTQARKSVLAAFDGPEQRPAAERCLSAPSAAPPAQLIPASDLRQIVQTATTITMVSEELHEARIIRLNSPHTPAAITSWLGDSIGWWEGNTLVVETKHFASSSELRMSPNSMFIVSPTTVVIERFTRTAENEINYVFTVDDPTYYTQPWTGETRLHKSTARMLEYACHEGNYSLANVLGSARALETESD